MDGWTELARAHTAAGDLLLLRERAGTVELRCNGWELMSNRAHHSEAALAVLACERIARNAATPVVMAGEGPAPLVIAGKDPAPPAMAGEDPAPLVIAGEGRALPVMAGEGPPSTTSRRRTQMSGWPAFARHDDSRADAPCDPPGFSAPNDTATAPRLLIGGLGLGYTLRAALDHLPQSARVTVAELLPEIIAWNRGPLAPLAGHPLDDPRVSVICADVAALLRAAEPACFDAVLLDTDNGPDAVMLAGNTSLYGPESLRLIRRALRPAGTLAVWSADPSPHFEHNLRSAGFQWDAQAVPARGAPNDPLHTIYLAWEAA